MPLDKGVLCGNQLSKGTTGNVVINLWGKVRRCKGVACPIADECQYEGSKKSVDESVHLNCRVEQKFLAESLKPFITLVELADDQLLMNIVGLHIIPQYVDLCQLLLEKQTIENITYEDGKGQIRVHPIFDEIRKAQREIQITMKNYGILEMAKKLGVLGVGRVSTGTDGDLNLSVEGDGDAYDEMSRSD